jgi:hypothetical protein
LWNNIGPVTVSAIIGAAHGAAFGGGDWIAAGAGAAVEAILGAVLQYELKPKFESETGAWWVWVNTGFITAMKNVTWYVVAFGPQAIAHYLLHYLAELRVGNTSFENKLEISGP